MLRRIWPSRRSLISAGLIGLVALAIWLVLGNGSYAISVLFVAIFPPICSGSQRYYYSKYGP